MHSLTNFFLLLTFKFFVTMIFFFYNIYSGRRTVVPVASPLSGYFPEYDTPLTRYSFVVHVDSLPFAEVAVI